MLPVLSAKRSEPNRTRNASPQNNQPTHIDSMATKLFVGNIDYNVTENDLQDHFAKAGTVVSVNIVQDRTTGKSRGFGFVEMATGASQGWRWRRGRGRGRLPRWRWQPRGLPRTALSAQLEDADFGGGPSSVLLGRLVSGERHAVGLRRIAHCPLLMAQTNLPGFKISRGSRAFFTCRCS